MPISFVGMAQLDDVSATATPQSTRSFGEVAKGYTVFRDRDLLVAKITPCFENGKIGQAYLDHEVGVGSTEFHIVRAGASVDERYLLHFLRSPSVRRVGTVRMTGSGGQRRVPSAFLETLQVPLPSLDEQRRIAAFLDRADMLRMHRRDVDDALGLAAEAVFGNMSVGNDWMRTTIGDVSTRITDGEHKTPRRADAGVPLLSARSIRDGWIDFDNVDHVDELEYAELSRRISPEPGDVLISCSGTIGRTAVVGDRSRFAMVRSAALVRPSAAVLPVFLRAHLASPALRSMMMSRANSSAQANLFQNQIRDLPIDVPPIELQREFAAQLAAIDAQRYRVQRAIDLHEELFVSLQSRAFKGEL